MRLNEKLKNIENKYAWGFIGVIIGIAGIAYAIYAVNFTKPYTEITLETKSLTNVVDINEPVQELRIEFKDQNLLETGKELKILHLSISNTGTENITQNKFDDNSNWGLRITNCKIIGKPEIIASSNNYLTRNLHSLYFDTLNRIVFPKIILDQEDYFDLKVLTIDDAGFTPRVELFGKISGIKKFNYTKIETKKSNGNVILRIFDNTLFSIISLIITLPALLIIGLIFLGLLFSRIQNYFSNRKKQKHIKRYKTKYKNEINEYDEFVFSMYKNHGKSYLEMSLDLLKENSLLQDLLFINEMEKEKLDKIDSSLFENVNLGAKMKLKMYVDQFPRNTHLIKSMENHQFIKIEGRQSDDEESKKKEFNILINESLVDSVNRFLEFLKYYE